MPAPEWMMWWCDALDVRDIESIRIATGVAAGGGLLLLVRFLLGVMHTILSVVIAGR